ncbi:MAG: universal stress protein [Terracidiphilus sp.]|jgi:nucleotide-binding universal stress UspA family protein
MKILLGIDDAKFSEHVIRTIVTQFRTENAEVLVLHVLQPVQFAAPPEMAPGYAPELEDQKQPARALVERIAHELRSAGFQAETAVQVGDATMNILDTAEEWQADLIVVGSHGHRGIQDLLLGNVAESVARQAKCSVEIVRAGQ